MKDPAFSKEDAYVLDRKHSYERALQKGLQMRKLIKEHEITDPAEVSILRRCWSVVLLLLVLWARGGRGLQGDKSLGRGVLRHTEPLYTYTI